MAKNYTGTDGALYTGSTKVAQTRSWSFSASGAVLPTTTLGDWAETAIYGNQSFSGSATIYYYENNDRTIDGRLLMDDLLRTTRTPQSFQELRLQFLGGSKTRELRFKCLLNEVSITASAGEITTAEITFTATGPLTTATII